MSILSSDSHCYYFYDDFSKVKHSMLLPAADGNFVTTLVAWPCLSWMKPSSC